MSGLLPLRSYTLELFPGLPALAIDEEVPVTVRITMAALDPKGIDGETEPSTLRILKRPQGLDEDDLIYGNGDMDGSDDEEENEEEDDDEDDDEDNEDDEDDNEDDDEDENDLDVEEFVVCTLSPSTSYQQTLDLVINAREGIIFEVTGSYPIHLTGNYVEHPDDNNDEDDEDDEGLDYENDDFDSDEYDLSPDESEVIDSSRIEELESSSEEEEEVVVEMKETKKRTVEPVAEVAPKKQKKEEKKSVAFTKELEQGPTGSGAVKPSKIQTQKLQSGVVIEDRTVGEGPKAAKGSVVGVRYIGKLANGKIFDSNTKGKPFYFNLGAGEVIKGWDIGVVGMAVKGERRIIIPAAAAYGKKALPGIPANSELTFDVKLVNIK